MEGSYLTAMVGLAGAAIGGFTSFAQAWFTERALAREKLRQAERARRERLYSEFIREAARLFGDALSHEKDEVSDLVTLYAMIAHMRLVSGAAVVQSAERVLQAIVATYLGPKRSLHEMSEFARSGGLDPILTFSEACRGELHSLG